MSALISHSLTAQTAKEMALWPTKNFPYNAILTTTGVISFYVLKKIFSPYNTLILTFLVIGATKLCIKNENAKILIVTEPQIAKIQKEISDLEDFENNNPLIMKKYLSLGKDTIKPMFDCFNKDKYGKIEKLAAFCNVKIADLVTIWKKHPNFDENSFSNRYNIFKNLLRSDIKKQFDALDG